MISNYDKLMNELVEFRQKWERFTSMYLPPIRPRLSMISDTEYLNDETWSIEYFKLIDQVRLFDKDELTSFQTYARENYKRVPNWCLQGYTNERRAKYYHEWAAKYIKMGNIYDAAYCYEIAETLFPGIEFIVDEKYINSDQNTQNIVPQNANGNVDIDIDSSDDERDELNDRRNRKKLNESIDLSNQLFLSISKRGRLFECATDNNDSDNRTHISALPVEMVANIINLAVTSDPDLGSLRRLGMVSKFFYICTKDERLSRQVCNRIWDIFVGTLEKSKYLTWRQMYLERPRIHFNGIYFSYINVSDNIENRHRQIMFYPGGSVIRITSTEKDFWVTVGQYRLIGDTVVVFMKRFARRPCIYNESTFIYEYKIIPSANRKFNKLEWKNFMAINSINSDNVIVTRYKKPIVRKCFPSFMFKEFKP